MDLEHLRIDPDILANWKLSERLEYRRHVGVNPEYAMWAIEEALDPVDEAAPRCANGMPAAVLDIDASYIIGLIWIAEHRTDKGLGYDKVRLLLDDFGQDDLVNVVINSLLEAGLVVLEEEPPEPPDPPSDEAAGSPPSAPAAPPPASETSSASASPSAAGPAKQRSSSRNRSSSKPSS
jgi:hypothetical protein